MNTKDIVSTLNKDQNTVFTMEINNRTEYGRVLSIDKTDGYTAFEVEHLQWDYDNNKFVIEKHYRTISSRQITAFSTNGESLESMALRKTAEQKERDRKKTEEYALRTLAIKQAICALIECDAEKQEKIMNFSEIRHYSAYTDLGAEVYRWAIDLDKMPTANLERLRDVLKSVSNV